MEDTEASIAVTALVFVLILFVLFWRSQTQSRINKTYSRRNDNQGAEENTYQTVWHALAAHIHAIENHVRKHGEEQERQDKARTIRECITIGALIIAGVAAALSDGYLYLQLVDARKTATIQHADTVDALNVAKAANDKSTTTATAQIEQMTKQSEAMRDQLNEIFAARLQSADAERARFFITDIKFNKTSKIDPTPNVTFKLLNLGRTSAIIDDISVQCEISNTEYYPKYNPDSHRSTMFAVTAGAVLDLGPLFPCHFDGVISPEDYAAIDAGTKVFVMKGYLDFQNVFKQIYRQSFGFYAKSEGAFYKMANPAENAETKR